ncbi:unnamed protein product [Mycena citricolor]|uniref:Polysaccharide lyase family 8 protein n=1 Tax=Mycena citricolor TaxID=2018698 RepID=A0AAD2Q2B0_9AGAR|nr:unnamed protein product [Mycena citricolor]
MKIPTGLLELTALVLPCAAQADIDIDIAIAPRTTAQDIATLTARRLDNIVGELTDGASVSTWLSTLNASGQWADVDYTTGCPAQRANWPAEIHWNRISTMAGAWHGGVPGAAASLAGSAALRAGVRSAMDFWFANDFTVPACLDSGGGTACPCGTPGFWNTNWFPNIIGTPELVSQTCLLLNSTLSAAELGSCKTITARAYRTFTVPANQVGVLTGANLLDVAKIGIDLALLTANTTLLTDAYSRVHAELSIKNATRSDGIRPDGGFGQHSGILYNGNYGKDYTNDLVDLEVEAGGTQFEASSASKAALGTLFTGDRWMIYRNVLTGVLHWDFSVLGRFIAFPTADVLQATSSILLNLTKIEQLGAEWGSAALTDFSSSLSQGSSSANAGSLVGNRMFFNNDYMVHRGAGYVSTLKMYSSRTRNTECTNLANPLGFHLSDGALRTYIEGNEYEDIAASMDWELIPGITVDYGATPLNCGQTGAAGIEGFVGGASDGTKGAAAMRYTNPLTRTLHWQKAWFFLPGDVQVVVVSNTSSATGAPVRSVLDQRLHAGQVVLNGSTAVSNATGVRAASLWHGNVGYVFGSGGGASVSVQVGQKTGDWAAIGTSPQPPTTVDLFAAWVNHDTSSSSSVAYTVYPALDLPTFRTRLGQAQPVVVRNDNTAAAVLAGSVAMAVFWAPGSVAFTAGSPAGFVLAANGTAAVVFDHASRQMTVSDPTQTLAVLAVTVTDAGAAAKTVTFTLPSGGLAGSSVTKAV